MIILHNLRRLKRLLNPSTKDDDSGAKGGVWGIYILGDSLRPESVTSRAVSGSEVYLWPSHLLEMRRSSQLSLGGCAPWWPWGPAQEVVKAIKPDPCLP